MTRPLGIRLFVMASALLGTFAAPTMAQETDDLSAMRQEALDLVNLARSEVGLTELDPSGILNQAAQDHAADMLDRDFYGHATPEGDTPFDRFIAAGGNRWAVSGENIATCEGCPPPPDVGRVQAFHEGWMQSPDHRENILSEGFDSFGFGIAGEGSAVYAVQTFSGPGADAADGDNTPVTQEAARDLALGEINAARATAGSNPLERSDALDTVAERVLKSLADDPEALPEDVFGLLPDGATGWTSLALQTASLGGSGVTLTRDLVARIVADWVSATEANQPLGGADASHLGFAAVAVGDGRTTAVAVFGGRQ